MEKFNEKLFGQISGKISFLTKLLMIVELIVGIFLILMGIFKYKVITYMSFGIGMMDESVSTGVTCIIVGLCMALIGWWLGLVVLGINKIVQRVEIEEEEEKKFWDEAESMFEMSTDDNESDQEIKNDVMPSEAEEAEFFNKFESSEPPLTFSSIEDKEVASENIETANGEEKK